MNLPVSVLEADHAPMRPERTDRIGGVLVRAGKLREEDLAPIRNVQRRRGMKFGEAAVSMGAISASDLQQALSSQFEYPYLVPGESNVSTTVVAAYQPFSGEVEALRDLRSQLMLAWPDSESRTKVLAISSAERLEGRTYLAANLAVVFSQLGERTLLIDADLRNPNVHRLFGVSGKQGLSTILSGRCDLDTVLPVPGFPDLGVLPSGGRPPNPQELLAKRAFRHVLDEYTAEFDVILLDTPALCSGSDAQVIGARARNVLIAARQDHSRLESVRLLLQTLKRSGTNVLGTALTRF